jgi:aspartate/tyrosine/aromatic aminotransferase
MHVPICTHQHCHCYFTRTTPNVTSFDRISLFIKLSIAIHDALTSRRVKGNWGHIMSQGGMFTYTGLKPEIVEKLKTQYHIYLLKSGRANMAGLNSSNIAYLADALLALLGTN